MMMMMMMVVVVVVVVAEMLVMTNELKKGTMAKSKTYVTVV